MDTKKHAFRWIWVSKKTIWTKQKDTIFGQTNKISRIDKFVVLEIDFNKNTIFQIQELDYLTMQIELIVNNNFYRENLTFYRLEFKVNEIKIFEIFPSESFFDYIIKFQPKRDNKSITIVTQASGSGGYKEKTKYLVNEKRNIIAPKNYRK